MSGEIMAVCRAIHIGAAVGWLGGMLMNMCVVMPAAREQLQAGELMRLHSAVHVRFARLVYASIAALLISGGWMTYSIILMHGHLDLTTVWYGIVFAKHALFFLMVGLAVYILACLLPSIQQAASMDSEEARSRLAALRARQHRLVRLNLWLAGAVLLLSSAAHVCRH